jgi:hypothetical protein
VDDRQVEDLLKRYRPSGPPDSLRARALTPSRHARVWPWATAAAALLAITVGLQGAAAGAMAAADIGSMPDTSAAAAELAEAFGGDAVARRMAEQFIDEELRRDREQVTRLTPPMGEMP